MIKKLAILSLLLILITPLYASAETASVLVDVDGQEYVINMETDGLDVQGIEGDGDLAMLLVVDVTSSSGTLEITFDRELFDSTFEGQDDVFFIILDGFDEAVFEETKTDSTRTLSIKIPSGTEEIEIIGSQILDGTFGEVVLGEPQLEVTEELEMIEEPEVTEEPEMIEEPEITEEPEVIEEQPKTQCGPGTVFKDGECVLEKTCGPGTHLENDVCVLDKAPSATPSAKLPPMSSLIYGAGAAFVIAFIVIMFLWIISRGSRQKTTV